MNKRNLIIMITLIFISFCSIVYAKYIINQEQSIDVKSSPFYFFAELEKEKVVTDKDCVNINMTIKNYLGEEFNTYATNYEITVTNNDKYVISTESGNSISETINGNSRIDNNKTIKLIPIEGVELAPEEDVVITIKSISPYAKEINLPVIINTNPSTLSGMELNFIIKNGTYAPEGDVYEYYSVDANRLKDETVKKIVFGKQADYQSNVSGIDAEPLDVNRTGIINLYRKLNSDNTTYTIYILSEDGKFELSDNAAWTFDKLYALESIENLHLVDTSKVVNMRDMFCDCAVLEDIDLSNFDTSNVTNMIGMFARCYALEYLDLLTFDVSQITEINQFVTHCENLKAIYVSNKWKLPTGAEVNTTSMFATCTNLIGGNGTVYDSTVIDGTRAIIDGTTPGYLTATYNFLDGTNVNHIIKAKTAEEIEAWTTSNRYTDTSVTSITFGLRRDYDNIIDGYDGVATDAQRSGAIKTYRIPNGNGTYSVYIISNSGTFIANSDNAWMFDKLAKLNKINNLTLLDTSKVTNMRDMFCDCQSLSEFDLSNFNTANVTTFQGIFARMYYIETLDLSGFNTSKATTMKDMFYAGISTTDTLEEYQSAVPKLKTIYVSNLWNTSNIATTEALFTNNVNLVGGAGTVFNSSNTTVTYARIDTATTPGYFTLKQ